MTALERAARAARRADLDWNPSDGTWHENVARAVLMAVRDYPMPLYVDSYCSEDVHPVENFGRMIDAILNEKDSTND